MNVLNCNGYGIRRPKASLAAQREVFGFDYAQVGVALAKHWDFSTIFCDAIEQQLDPVSYESP